MLSDAVAKRMDALPASCIDDVLRYIDLVTLAYKGKNALDDSRDISEFFGTVPIAEDPLQIQRSLRDEWQ